MKKVILLLTGVFLMTAFAGVLSAQDAEVSKTIKKEFNVNADALLKVHNKFGEVKIENWDKNQVSFNVELTAEAKNEDKAREVLKKMKVEISGSKSLVEAMVDLSDVKCNNNCKYEVVMNIMMPASISVDVLVEYGRFYAEEINGEAKIGLKYGAMNVDALNSSEVKLFLKYSDVEIDIIKKADIDIAYSELSIDMAEGLRVKSAYSEVEIDEVRSIELDSQYDEYDIDNCYSFAMDSKFTDVEIDELSKDLVVEMDYGNLEIERINKNFNKIHIETEYANASLGIDSDASYSLQGEAKYGNISYPKDHAKISKETEGYTKNYYSGMVGKDQNPQSEVVIKCKNANVELY